MSYGRKTEAFLTMCLMLVLVLGVVVSPETGTGGNQGGGGDKHVAAPVCRIACVGDSITQGVGAKAEESYPAYLQTLAGEDVLVENYGSRGRALLAASRHPYTREKCYRDSLEQAADIYIIMLGSNDIWEDCWDGKTFQEELEQLIRTYQQVQSTPCVYVAKPPEYFPKERDRRGQQKKAYMADLFAAISAAAERTGCQVIDLYSLTKENPEWFADEVHPNATGNQKIAEHIYACIAQDIG